MGRSLRLRDLVAAAGALLLAACATPAAGPQLAAPMANDPPPLRSYVPQDGKAHPGVLLVPGCGAPLLSARAALYERTAVKLRDAGFAVAIFAYPGSGMGDPACERVAEPAALAAMIAGALAQLRATPGVDPARLHLVGWSWGARGVLELVTAERRLPGLVSAVAFYPFCPPAKRWASAVTLQLYLAEKDTVSPPEACRAWADVSDGPGPVAITRYVGVGHGFDVAEAGDARFAAYRTGLTLTFDVSTAWQAWKDLIAFLGLKLPGA
jgi:dienelactone hydrolase